MYRLNCQIPEEIRERMNPYIERTGVSIASLVAMSLDKFLSEDAMRNEMSRKMSDPDFMVKVVAAMADRIEIPGLSGSPLKMD